MCDRTRQVTQFYKFFMANVFNRRGLPQIYLVHGEEGQGHDSLVKRVIIDKIERYAVSLKGSMEGTTLPIKTEVQPWKDIEEVKENLLFGIFEKVSPDFDPRDLSVRQFCNHRKLRAYPFVVIQHDFELTQWGFELRELIEWYLTTYWMEAGICGSQILIFLNFIYAYSRMPQWLRFPSKGLGKAEFAEFLKNLSTQIDAAYPCLLLDELGHLDEREVCRTLEMVGIHEEEECPNWLKTLFKQKRGKVRMVEVEKLIKIHSKSLVPKSVKGVQA